MRVQIIERPQRGMLHSSVSGLEDFLEAAASLYTGQYDSTGYFKEYFKLLGRTSQMQHAQKPKKRRTLSIQHILQVAFFMKRKPFRKQCWARVHKCRASNVKQLTVRTELGWERWLYTPFSCHTVFTAGVLALISLVDLRHLGQGVRPGAGVCEGNTYFTIADLRYCKVFHLVVHIYSIYLISSK